MAAITVPTVADRTDVRTADSRKPVWLVGAGAGVVAAGAATLVAVVAKAADVPMKAAPKSAEAGKAIPLNGFAFGVLMSTAIGIGLAMLLVWKAKRPARTFVVVTTLLTIASFSGPITTGHATTATRVVLALTHVVAAAIVIPVIARRLADA